MEEEKAEKSSKLGDSFSKKKIPVFDSEDLQLNFLLEIITSISRNSGNDQEILCNLLITRISYFYFNF